MFELFHNNRCSKSRECLKLLNQQKIKFEIFEYSKIEIKKKKIQFLIDNLEGPLESLVRKCEPDFKENFFDTSNKEKIADFLINYPKCIQRPIFFNGHTYVICRPPEKVLEYINK
tara:strand:+ start:224 stop:568 length:345 start_codon:yes stop_codon:yes gene_type:complete